MEPLHTAPLKLIVGWQEWVILPGLPIPAIKAKIDTGARTSALHADSIKIVRHHHQQIAYFTVCPISHNQKIIVHCHAPVVDQRLVRSSTGHPELRYVIETSLQLGELQWPIQITLTNRDPMRFRMLLGRQALRKMVWVDPGKHLLHGKLLKKQLKKIYKFT